VKRANADGRDRIVHERTTTAKNMGRLSHLKNPGEL
jgi:hypothetical protein